jgi:hypothetical protein
VNRRGASEVEWSGVIVTRDDTHRRSTRNGVSGESPLGFGERFPVRGTSSLRSPPKPSLAEPLALLRSRGYAKGQLFLLLWS